MVTSYNNPELRKTLLHVDGGIHAVTARLQELGPILSNSNVVVWEEALGLNHLASSVCHAYQFNELSADQLGELVDLAASALRLAEDLAMRLPKEADHGE